MPNIQKPSGVFIVLWYDPEGEKGMKRALYLFDSWLVV